MRVLSSLSKDTLAAYAMKVEEASGEEHRLWLGTLYRVLLQYVFDKVDMNSSQPITFNSNELAGYPKDVFLPAMDPNLPLVRTKADFRLESFARSFLLATPAMIHPELSGSLIDPLTLRNFLFEKLDQVIDPDSPYYFDTSKVPADVPSQSVVEAATICLCLRLIERSCGNLLNDRTRNLLLMWLRGLAFAKIHPNNWTWFRYVIQTSINHFSKETLIPVSALKYNLQCILSMKHETSGWYHDGIGGVLDYYNAWGFNFWASYARFLWPGDSSTDSSVDSLLRTIQLSQLNFINDFANVFDRYGRNPSWGRSACYRFAVVSPFATYAETPEVYMMRDRGHTPVMWFGEARALVLKNVYAFMREPGFYDNGLPSLGFIRKGDSVVDPYSSVASPLWCSTAFLCLVLPKTHAFWSVSTRQLGPGASPVRASPHATCIQTPPQHPLWDPQDARYCQREYRSDTFWRDPEEYV